MKAGKAHTVALASGAIELLATVPRIDGNPYVFPGARRGKPLSNMAMLEKLRDARPGFTVHGFRSSFRDWAAETTNHDNNIVEQALAHTISNKVEAAYRRGTMLEKRRILMQEWADYLLV